MADINSIFIPKRINALLRSIYQDRVTVICAPDGSGKSTLLRGFTSRTRSGRHVCPLHNRCGQHRKLLRPDMLPHLREGIQRAGNRPGIAHAAAAVRENRQKKPTAACGGLRLLPGHTPRESAHGAAAEGMLLRKFRISVQLHKPVSPKAVRTAWVHPPRPAAISP